jgi:mono/diheme cytochrome c family protein
MPGLRAMVRLSRTASAVTLSLTALVFLSACKARTPSRFETAVVQNVKRRVTIGGVSDINPLVASDENIHDGLQNFTSYCMVCHGLDGQNTGVPFADKMSPPVPSLSSPSVQAYTDGQLHWIIQNGIFPSGMPASKDVFRDEEIWQLVTYIRHLPSKGGLGEPAVYGGDPGAVHGTSTAEKR